MVEGSERVELLFGKEELDVMKCPECGYENGSESIYCSQCGAKLIKHTENRTGTGSDEFRPGAPEGRSHGAAVSEGDILDRELQPYSGSEKRGRSRRIKINLILVILLLLITGLSAYGVKRVAAMQEHQEEQRVLEIQRREAEEKAALRKEYLRKINEYLILAQAQQGDFQKNLEELAAIENKRWMDNRFLRGFFNSFIEKFTQLESYTAMTKRDAAMQEAVQKLGDAPEGLADLGDMAENNAEIEEDISGLFQGELESGVYEEVSDKLTEYAESLRETAALYGTSIQ